MRKFLKHIVVFIAPIIIAWVILMYQPLDKKRAFHYLTEDCEGRGAWMYKRIFESSQPIDIAFLGSSHTINGINDTLINKLIEHSGSDKKVANMGYCRHGRDLTYLLMKMLIEQKKTQTFIIEVLVNEEANSHPVFPYLADSKYIIDPQTITNKNYFSNFYNGSVAKWMYMRQNIFSEPYPYKYPLTDYFGFTTNTFEADTNLLGKYPKNKKKQAYKKNSLQKWIDIQYPKKWIEKISSLAIQHDCNIHFLFIPSYGKVEKIPNEIHTYNKYGSTWILPDSILSNKRNWYDREHLNLRGANETSKIIAEKILMLK